MGDVSTNFNRADFACKCGCGWDAVDKELLYALEDLRFYFMRPITINSGNRCHKHNATIPGHSKKSKHCLGVAADIVVDHVDPKRVYQFLDKKYPDKYGIGLYPWGVHIDVRAEKARW